MKSTIRIEGELNVSKDIILRFHPELKGLLKEIKERGWSYSFVNVKGKAHVVLDLNKIEFRLEYYPPRIEELEEEGVYEIRAEVGSEPPAALEVEAIDSFQLAVSTQHARDCVEVDPVGRIITYIQDVLWDGIRLGKERGAERLSEAREVYEVVKFFLDKGYGLKNSYTVEKYKQLVDLFEKPYRFTITLELTVQQEDKVPSWHDLVDQLAEFFRERGLLMKLMNDRKKMFFQKPIP